MSSNIESKLQPGDVFHLDRVPCTVLEIGGISYEPHYKFNWQDDSGKLHAGLMPVCFVDSLTGYDIAQTKADREDSL